MQKKLFFPAVLNYNLSMAKTTEQIVKENIALLEMVAAKWDKMIDEAIESNEKFVESCKESAKELAQGE